MKKLMIIPMFMTMVTGVLYAQCADVIPPTASNPDTIFVPCNQSVPVPDPAVVSDAEDNSGVTVVTWVSDVSDGGNCVEIITRTYQVSDTCDNTILVTQIIKVMHSGTLTIGANGGSSITCPAEAIDPGPPPSTTDGCGQTVYPVLVGSTSLPSCIGTVNWTYRYTTCDGSTFSDWVYTYTISSPTVTMPANGSSTVACPEEAIAPTAPTVLDNCGRTLTVSAPVISPGPACAGTKTYAYTYMSCSGTNYNWVYTYTVTCPDTIGCSTSGVSNSDIPKWKIQVYPNPSNGEVNLSADVVNGNIELYNLVGERVYSTKMESNTTKLNISELEDGVYILILEMENGEFIKERIVLKR